MEVWRETFEITADSKLIGQIRQVCMDSDRAAGKKGAFTAPGMRITNPQCVNKSFPVFWDELEKLTHIQS